MRYQKNRRRPINLKSLPRARREQLRTAAFRAFQQKRTAYAVAKELQLNESCVGAWFRRFAEDGEQAVAEKKRGPSVSPHATLSTEERAALAKAITGSTPDQLMFDFALWSSRAVVALCASASTRAWGGAPRGDACSGSASPANARSAGQGSRTRRGWRNG